MKPIAVSFIVFCLLLSAGEVSQSIWWHYLVINIPDQVDFKDTGFLYITGGSNHDRYVCIHYHNESKYAGLFFMMFVCDFA